MGPGVARRWWWCSRAAARGGAATGSPPITPTTTAKVAEPTRASPVAGARGRRGGRQAGPVRGRRRGPAGRAGRRCREAPRGARRSSAPVPVGRPDAGSVDDAAAGVEHGDDGHQVEGGVGHHVHAQPAGPVRDEGQDARRTRPARPAGRARRGPARTAARRRPPPPTRPTVRAGRRAERPRGEQPGQRPEEQPPEEQLLEERGADHREDGDDREARRRGPRRSACWSAPLKLWRWLMNGGVEQRHQDLAPDADERCRPGRWAGTAGRGRPRSAWSPGPGWPATGRRRSRPTGRPGSSADVPLRRLEASDLRELAPLAGQGGGRISMKIRATIWPTTKPIRARAARPTPSPR